MGRAAAAMSLVCLCLTLSAVRAAADAPLTNEDVVTLVKLALGDDVVLAKIRQAPAVNFKLDPDDLGKLKAAGVSSTVIAAMLEKSTAPTPAPPPRALGAAQAGAFPMGVPGVTGVDLVDKNGTRTLPSQSGETSQTNYVVGMLLWFNVHDAHASVRTIDRDLFIRVYSGTRLDEVGAFVRLEANEEDRSLKIGNMNALSFRGPLGFKVDKGWIIASNITESESGVWELRPKAPLPPGEYGFYTTGMRMFSFGVD